MRNLGSCKFCGSGSDKNFMLNNLRIWHVFTGRVRWFL